VSAFAVVSSVGDNAPVASAVTLNDDGTVSVEVSDLDDLPAANQTLQDAGIRAKLVNLQPHGSCEPGTELGDPLPMPDDLVLPHKDGPSKPTQPIVTFRSDRIPAGTTLVLLTAVGDEGQTLWTPGGNTRTIRFATRRSRLNCSPTTPEPASSSRT
jgi:hypothetical protein